MLMTRCQNPVCTNNAVTRRHHSPLVVRGPTLAPHATSVSGSAIAPAPKIMPMKTPAFTATSTGSTIGHGVRVWSASRNASRSRWYWTARSAASRAAATPRCSSFTRSSGFMT